MELTVPGHIYPLTGIHLNCLFVEGTLQNDSGVVGQWPKAEIKLCTVMSCLVAMCSHAAMP